jgi:hypothetical protein
MDNRINEIRRRISVLRAEMVRTASAMHDQIRRDLDCTEAALQLMGLRKKLAVLVAEWRAAGGSETPPTIEERLKAKRPPGQGAKGPHPSRTNSSCEARRAK